MTQNELRAEVLLSLQRALLGEIGLNVRGITCDWDTTSITIQCIFDGEISDDDQEAMEVACTEVMADFPPDVTVNRACKRLDAPEPLNSHTLTVWVYRRKE